MKTERSLPLFRLSLAGLAGRGSCWLLLLGGMLFAWLAPLLTPWEEKPVILQPARAQAAWIYAWLALFTWLPMQAAGLGSRLRKEGILEHFQAGGRSQFNLCGQILGAVLVWLAAVALLAAAVCLIFCMPARAEEARQWTWLVLQYMALYGAVGTPLLMLAVALGTRISEVVAYLIPAALLFLGLFGTVWLLPFLSGTESALLKSGWLAVPHYHLADLTPRLVFKMGPLPFGGFTQTLTCLVLQGLALGLASLCTFRTRS